MKHINNNRKRQKSDFRKLLAKCMAKALFTYDKRKHDDESTLDAKSYKEIVSRLENDILLEDEEDFQAF